MDNLRVMLPVMVVKPKHYSPLRFSNFHFSYSSKSGGVSNNSKSFCIEPNLSSIRSNLSSTSPKNKSNFNLQSPYVVGFCYNNFCTSEIHLQNSHNMISMFHKILQIHPLALTKALLKLNCTTSSSKSKRKRSTCGTSRKVLEKNTSPWVVKKTRWKSWRESRRLRYLGGFLY